MKELFNTLLFEPIFNLLVFFYNTIAFEDLGVAIILVTLTVKLLLFPLTRKQIKAQKEMAKIQPLMKEIQEEYKDQPDVKARKTMELYKEHGVNPLGSCLPLLIQLPIFIAMYQAMKQGLKDDSLKHLYTFIDNPGELKSVAFGFLDLGKSFPALAVLAAFLQFIQAKMMMARKKNDNDKKVIEKKDEKDMTADVQAMTQKQMTYMMPAMIGFISWGMPAGVPLYWSISSMITIVQQFIMYRDEYTSLNLFSRNKASDSEGKIIDAEYQPIRKKKKKKNDKDLYNGKPAKKRKKRRY